MRTTLIGHRKAAWWRWKWSADWFYMVDDNSSRYRVIIHRSSLNPVTRLLLRLRPDLQANQYWVIVRPDPDHGTVTSESIRTFHARTREEGLVLAEADIRGRRANAS